MSDVDDPDIPETPDSSLASTRSRRGPSKKTNSRFEALKKLKAAKSRDWAYEVKEEDAVYDVVDEKEYAERVKGRVEEGFIVDDDGEYVEDGREIFDEDADDETSASGGKYKGPREAKRKKEEEKKKRRGNIKNMLMNMGGGSSGKQKGSGAAAAGIKDDDVLESLLGDMKSSTTKAKPGSAAGKRKATSPPEKAPTGNKGGIQ